MFKRDGTFKLTVFSDLHFGENPWDDWGPEQDVNSLTLMDKVLADEKPDYVYVLGLFSLFLVLKMLHDPRVLNGDLITGESRQRILTIFPLYPKTHEYRRPKSRYFQGKLNFPYRRDCRPTQQSQSPILFHSRSEFKASFPHGIQRHLAYSLCV